jgi:glutamyl-tRNA reductase
MSSQRFHIHCLGLNHHTASLALRERLVFSPHHIETSLALLGSGDGPIWSSIQELIILSTCNRVELYAIATHPIFGTLETFLSETRKTSVSDFSSLLYRLLDEDAIHHLLHVAAGLDSIVLGEPQILGQVIDAYMASQRHGMAGKILSRLFQSAIRVGKRARTETAISHNPATISSVAVKLISQTVPDLPAAKIMVLGAGEMAGLAVEALRKRGASNILVVNRNLQRGQELARRWDGRSAALVMLPELLPEMDILITSTGAAHTVIHPSMVEKTMGQRPRRPLVIMDIAVPRDVDAEVKNVPGVCLFDMDTLSEELETYLARRESEVPKVETIIAEEQTTFVDYMATLDIVPIIVEMREQANYIRQIEVEKAIRRMSHLTPEMQGQIDALTKSIVNKILHSPTAQLKEEANGPNAADYTIIARGLFGLD